MNFADEVNAIEAKIAALHKAFKSDEIPADKTQYEALDRTIRRLKGLQGVISSKIVLTKDELWQMQADYFS